MKLKRKVYETQPEKTRDLLIGFFGWFVINGLVWILLYRFAGGDDPDFYIVGICVFPPNVIVPIVLAFLRKWMALGVLVAIALNLVVSLFLGLGGYGACGIPVFLEYYPGLDV